MLAAFQTIDNFILSGNDTILRRLAYVQLVSLLDSLVDNIATDRARGFVHRATSYRNATIALDIYMSAQQRNATSPRSELLERKRTGQRWLQLAGPSPFTLILYSDVADQVMYVSCFAIYPIILTINEDPRGLMIWRYGPLLPSRCSVLLRNLCTHAFGWPILFAGRMGPSLTPTIS